MSSGLAPLSERLSNLRSPDKCPENAIFSGDNLNDEQATTIAEVVKISKTILRLWLDRNAIKAQGAKELGDALNSNTSMEYLNISANQINFEGATSIFKGLKVNRTLLSLQFNQNNIPGPNLEGLEPLVLAKLTADLGRFAVALQFNKTLQELSLADNRMTDNILQQLSKGLSANRSLTSLNLAGNAFTGTGIMPSLAQGTCSKVS